MEKKLNIILYTQCHLPSGAADSKFEAIYETEIKPAISALNKYPGINMLIHYSGVILHWIERRHPEIFMLLEDLLNRKQIEFLGGGFYNPALTLLPLADKIGQIEMLTTYLRKNFGKRPQGCWLPSMTWEQNLVGPLNSCGMNYTLLEEGYFKAAGLKPSPLGVYQPCITEDQGKLIIVFPVSSSLGRELIKGKPLVVLGRFFEKPDMENDTQILVFPINGIEYKSFFAGLSGADPNIRVTCPSRIFKNLASLKKVYFPCEWASADPLENRVTPRQFLTINPEADGIYSKMIYVHMLINNQLRGDKTRKRTALEELWKAQDSSLFCLDSNSSPFILDSNVRKAAYRSLLEAEKIIREKKKNRPSLSVFDFDLDGAGEYIFQDEKFNCCIKSRGSGIFELDYLPCTWNYIDAITSRKKALQGVRRCAFMDWLVPEGTKIEEAEGIRGGRFCGDEVFEVIDTDRVHRRVVFRLPPKPNAPYGEIEILKSWQLKKNSIALEYVLKNTSTKTLIMIFGSSLDISFPGDSEVFLRILAIREGEKENIKSGGVKGESITAKNLKTIEFQDIKNETVITLDGNRGFDWQIFHNRLKPNEPDGYQSTRVMPFMQVSLEGGKMWKASFSIKISS